MTALIVVSIRRTTNQTIASANTWTAISFDASTPYINDIAGVFATGTPTRLTVPSGYAYARLVLWANWENNGSTARRGCRIKKNGTPIVAQNSATTNEGGQMCETEWLAVVAGDYFEADAWQSVGANFNLNGASWPKPSEFQIELQPA